MEFQQFDMQITVVDKMTEHHRAAVRDSILVAIRERSGKFGRSGSTR
jgi:hypothetical protein